jgi:hypothetical protein
MDFLRLDQLVLDGGGQGGQAPVAHRHQLLQPEDMLQPCS